MAKDKRVDRKPSTKTNLRDFKLPFVVERNRENQQIVFYGSEHTNDPKHPQFADIETRWSTFIKSSNNPIALVEGHFDECTREETRDREQSIVSGGEAQFVVHLARRDGIPVASPEPDRASEADELAQEFGRDAVIFYYFLRQLGWWNRMAVKPDMWSEAEKMLGQLDDLLQWENVNFSISRMETIHKEVFGRQLSWDDDRWLYDITTPAPQHHITNVIAARSGEMRDRHILSEIQRYWQKSYSPFAVFGAGHAVVLEPALLSLGGSTEANG